MVPFLIEKKPDFLSGQILKNNILVRGSSRIRRLKLNELGPSSYYMSGLVFNKKNIHSTINLLRPFLDRKGCDYPHTMILLCLGIKNNCWYYNKPLTKKNFQLKGYYDDRNPFSLTGRLNQYICFDEFINKLIKTKKSNISYYKDLSEIHKKSFLFWIINGLLNEKKDLIKFKYLNPLILSKFLLKTKFKRNTLKT